MMLKLKCYKYLIKFFFSFLLFFSSISLTFGNQLDENIKRKGFNDISTEIFSSINKDARIALSPVSSLSNKKILPIIISTVHSEIKSSLTEVSDLKVYLVDKTKLEDAWSNAIEFNKLKFDNIIKDAKFDYLLKASIDTSETQLLLQVSITSTKGGSVGKVVYDSGLKKIPFNWKDLEGIEIIDQADAAKILANIKKLQQKNLIIEEPKTFEEFYINYKIYSSKNALQDALRSLEGAIKINNTYVDLIDDFINYSFTEFNALNGAKYIRNKLYPHLDMDRKIYADYVLGDIDELFVDCDFTQYRLNGNCNTNIKTFFLPSLNQLIKREGLYFLQKEINNSKKPVRHYLILEASRRIISAEKTGEFSKYYIDKQRASSELELQNSFNIEAKLNFGRYHVKLLKNYIPGNSNLIGFYPVDNKTGKSIIKADYGWLSKNVSYWDWGSLQIVKPTSESLQFKKGKNKFFPNDPAIFNYINLVQPKFIKYLDPNVDYKSNIGDWPLMRYFLLENHITPAGDERAFINYKYRDFWGPCASKLGLLDNDSLRSRHLEFTKESKENGFTSVSKLFRAPYPKVMGSNSNYWPKIENLEGDKFHTHSVLSAENDRLLWADFCLLKSVSKKINLDKYNKNDQNLNGYKKTGFNLSGFNMKKNKQGYITFEFPVISNLIITDNVDVNRPIILSGVADFNDNYSTNVKEKISKQTVVSYVRPGGPADKGRMLVGDDIIKIDDKKVNSFSDISEIIAVNPNVLLVFQVLRNNKIISLNITPEKSKEASGRGLVGINFYKPKNLGLKGKHLVEFSVSDISADGTLFDPFGVDLDETQRARSVPPYNATVLFENGWLSIPGIVQSSIGLNKIDTITYYDINGRKKTIKPNIVNTTPREDLEFINNDGLYFTIHNLGILFEKNNPNLKNKSGVPNYKFVENEVQPSIFNKKKPSISQKNIYDLFALLADDIPENWLSTQNQGVKNIKSVFDNLDATTKQKLIYHMNDKISYLYKMNPLYSQNIGPLSLIYIGQAFNILTKDKKMSFDLSTESGIKTFFNEILKL